jgi:predicted transcriptional regulator
MIVMESDPADLVPADLVPAIQTAAAEEHRSPQEIVVEAVVQYLRERRYFSRNEVHSKIAEGLESLRQGRGIDGEAVMTELLAELEALPAR